MILGPSLWPFSRSRALALGPLCFTFLPIQGRDVDATRPALSGRRDGLGFLVNSETVSDLGDLVAKRDAEGANNQISEKLRELKR